MRFKDSSERISTLRAFLAALRAGFPLICEIKSHFDGDMRLTDRTSAVAASYSGPLALKSFDPAVIAHLRAGGSIARSGSSPRRAMRATIGAGSARNRSKAATAFLHYPETRPDFLSWNVDDLPHPTPALLRALAAMPVMVWTVKTPEQRQRAKLWADQIVFDGAPD